MKLTAIRLAEFGPFFEGVALEGLSGGLNVLMGPNEWGKSTILRALQVLFSEPHTGQNKIVRACRSYRGGAPLVEAEFEIAKRRWRLRKRYLTGKSAELVSLADGQMWRNQDAEEQLSKLLAACEAIPGARTLLWVEQTKSFATPDGREQDQLSGAITAFIKREAAVVTGGGNIAQVKGLAEQALERLVTGAKRHPRKGGPLALATLERDRLSDEVEALRNLCAQSEARAGHLAELRAREQDVISAARKERMATELEAAQHAFAAAQTARERLSAAHYKMQASEAELNARQAAITALTTRIADIERVEAELSNLTRCGAAQEEAGAAAKAMLGVAGGELAALEERLSRARGTAREAEVGERLAVSMAARRELSERSLGAEKAEWRLRDLEAQLAGATVRASDVARLRVIESEVRERAAGLTSTVAGLAVAYDQSAVSRFRVGVRDLIDGEQLSIEGPLVVVVPGTGRITVSPGRADEIERMREALAGLEVDRSVVLAQMQVSDLEAAEARLLAQAEIAREGDAVRAELRALAPDGVASLQRRLSQLDAEIGECESAMTLPGDGGEESDARASAGDLLAQVELLALQVEQKRDAVRSLQRQDQDQRLALQSVIVGRQHAERRYEELATGMPTRDQWAAHLAAIDADVRVARSALQDVVREQEAWRARAPDDIAFEGMREQLRELGERRQREAEEVQDLRLQISALEARMDELRESDVLARFEHRSAALARAERRALDLEEEVEALLLIVQELSAAEAGLQAQVLAPLMDRLAPLVQQVLDGQGLELGGPLDVSGIRRGGGIAPVADLSDGTREQLAVMVRLAYARMFADLGAPVPLILDDALVFSDDGRLAEMFKLLAAAARAHQVLVLSCHEQAFQMLVSEHGARQLEIKPWTEVAVPRAV